MLQPRERASLGSRSETDAGDLVAAAQTVDPRITFVRVEVRLDVERLLVAAGYGA